MPAGIGRAIFLWGLATYYENIGRTNLVRWKNAYFKMDIIKLGGREGWKVGKQEGGSYINIYTCVYV